MAIRITTAVYSYGDAPGVSLYGDGASETISVDLSKAPFNMDFGGNNPVAAEFVDPFTGEYVNAEISGGGRVVKMTFSQPLSANSGFNISVTLFFNGQS